MTARIVPGGDCREIEMGSQRVRRQKDGSFHVPDSKAKALAQAIGGFVAGTGFFFGETEAPGPWCEHGQRPFFCEEGCRDRDLASAT